MIVSSYLQQARTEQDKATAEAFYAEIRACLARRPGLAYAATDQARSTYLVTYDGQEIGQLEHAIGAPALEGWYARLSTADPDNDGIGPFRTSRQAAAALLDSTSAADHHPRQRQE